MTHPMSEFSHRSHDIFRQGIPHTPGPFSPEELPSIQYEMHGETTVDQRATEMLRKPTEAEIKQLGSDFQSDLGPHNYRKEAVYIPEEGGVYREFDLQTDFQVWSIMLFQHSFINPATGIAQPPNGEIWLLDMNTRLSQGGGGFVTQPAMVNLPSGQRLRFAYLRSGGGAATGTGYHLIAFDRWLPTNFNSGV